MRQLCPWQVHRWMEWLWIPLNAFQVLHCSRGNNSLHHYRHLGRFCVCSEKKGFLAFSFFLYQKMTVLCWKAPFFLATGQKKPCITGHCNDGTYVLKIDSAWLGWGGAYLFESLCNDGTYVLKIESAWLGWSGAYPFESLWILEVLHCRRGGKKGFILNA